MEISEHMTLEMKNLLSFRAKMTQQEFAAKATEFESVIAAAGAKKSGPVVTATFSVEQGALGPVMDTEFLIPLDKAIAAPVGYVWKPHFLLTNAVMVKHVGHPSGMQETVNALNAYIAEHQLVPITPGYNVTVKDARTPLELNEMVVDIYVGISPNTL